ncbi:MAG: ribonucleoside-diphosphate reductase, adenosylcobalamin-dependent, partial [Anaerolineaceae bacterium]|nr:ribonucleoside-diphosphate reductase, adenosylcobalamin-dependent [Anaerolineaceae bacterium]
MKNLTLKPTETKDDVKIIPDDKGATTYSYEEAYRSTLEYFKGDELAASVWINKYALKDSFGKIYERDPDQMHWRIAREIARIEQKYPNPLSLVEIHSVLKDFRYIVPQGSPMTGIGNSYQIASLSNCFVIGNSGASDSYGGIMKIDQEQVQLMKRRGGVGHDLSHIRPKGTPVLNSALTSTGVVPFMERYSNSTREVAQDGRRGALMLSISIKHPDSEQFIDAKLERGKVTGANISVRINDEFMKAVVNNDVYEQHYPVDSSTPVFTRKIEARKLWEKIVHNAWKSAEPGILFWDTIIRESVPDCYANQGYKTVSTNPCGEIPLCPYDSCRLLAINLYSYVNDPFTPKAVFD